MGRKNVPRSHTQTHIHTLALHPSFHSFSIQSKTFGAMNFCVHTVKISDHIQYIPEIYLCGNISLARHFYVMSGYYNIHLDRKVPSDQLIK